MTSRIILACLLFAVAKVAYAQSSTVDVPPGDVAALQKAIEEANAQPAGHETTLYVAGIFEFAEQDQLPAIKRPIRMTGGTPTEFRGKDGGPLRLIEVAEGAALTLEQIEFTNFQPDSWLNDEAEKGFIEVAGRLELQAVQFDRVYTETWCLSHGPCANPRPILYNHRSGEIRINRSSFIDTGTAIINIKLEIGGLLENHGSASITNSQLMLSQRSAGWIRPIHNLGDLRVVHSSFVYFRSGGAGNEFLSALAEGQVEFGNSVIGGFEGTWCARASSLGGNLVDSPDCDWTAEGDLNGKPTGLIWRPVTSYWRTLDYALVPSAASLAIDSALPELCPSDSLLRFFDRGIDGNGDGVAGCDRGAVETRPSTLSEGGINGFYYNPKDDGHYVYIQQTDFLTLVMWNTFDSAGNPLWLYGLGDLVNGRSVVADAYVNRSGGFSQDGIVTEVEAEYWGTLSVDMESCLKGTVAYSSAWPEFGDGQFPIERLAYVKQLGCSD